MREILNIMTIQIFDKIPNDDVSNKNLHYHSVRKNN